MIKFLFWNIAKKRLEASVSKLVREHDIDVVALVECGVSTDDMLAALNDAKESAFSAGTTELDDVAVFARLGERSFRTASEDPATRLSIRQLILPSGMDILLAVTHLPSKLYWSDASQSQLFDNDHLRILESSGNDSLLTASGLPDKSAASDHLPIVFGLEL